MTIRPLLVAFLLFFALNLPVLAGGRDAYFSIGEVCIPNFIGAVTDLGAYAEKVRPGTSMMLAGGAMALSFKYPGFNLNSGIRAIGYADSKDPLKKSHYAVILTPSGAVELQNRIKAGRTTLFVKKLDGKALLSDSMDFLNTFKSLPKSPKLSAEIDGISAGRKPVIYLKSNPAKFFAKAGDSLPSFKSLMSQCSAVNTGLLSVNAKGRGEDEKSATESAAETFFKQCDSVETRIYASAKTFILHFTLAPSPGSKFESAMKSLNGKMSYDVLDKVVSETLADPSFKLTEKFNKALDVLSKESQGKYDAKTILAALPKLQFSARNSRMLVEYRLPAEILRTALLDAGVLQKLEPHFDTPSSSEPKKSRRK